MKEEILNHKKVQGLEASGEDYLYCWETNFKGAQFGVRVSPKTDLKTFVIRFTIDGEQNWDTLGNFEPGTPNHTTVAEARKNARNLVTELDKGNDPTESEESSEEEDNFEELIDSFFSTYGEEKLKESTLSEYRRMANKDLIPEWGDMAPDDISKSDVIDLLFGIADDDKGRGSKTIADRTRALISKVFNWALEQDRVDSNPCSGTPTYGNEDRRERTLAPNEIKTLWAKTEDEVQPFKGLTRFILLTGQRFGETRKAKRSHIYMEPTLGCQVWTIPENHAKNGRKNIVPLPPLARKVLEKLDDEMDSESDYLFESPKKSGKPIRWLQNARKRLEKKLNYDEGKSEKGFRFHDLRRTCANGLDKLGIERITIGKLLNHKSIDSSVTAGYIPRNRLPEKKEAMFQWNEYVQQIIGENDHLSNQQDSAESLIERLNNVQATIESEELSTENFQEVSAQIKTIHSQLESKDPSEVIIEECKKKIRQTLEEEVGEEQAKKLINPS